MRRDSDGLWVIPPGWVILSVVLASWAVIGALFYVVLVL